MLAATLDVLYWIQTNEMASYSRLFETLYMEDFEEFMK